MAQQTLDRTVLALLRAYPKDVFQVEQIRLLIGRSLQIGNIRRALGRLRKKKQVRRQLFGRGDRYWSARLPKTVAKAK